MSEIREEHYSIDLPGEWERGESLEEGTTVYREEDGHETLTVIMLRVAPVFATIADPKMLLEQYMDHRGKFEKGSTSQLETTPPLSEEHEGWVEGTWSGEDPETDRLVLHRAILAGDLLVDFRYVGVGMDDMTFTARAGGALASASVTPDTAE